MKIAEVNVYNEVVPEMDSDESLDARFDFEDRGEMPSCHFDTPTPFSIRQFPASEEELLSATPKAQSNEGDEPTDTIPFDNAYDDMLRFRYALNSVKGLIRRFVQELYTHMDCKSIAAKKFKPLCNETLYTFIITHIPMERMEELAEHAVHKLFRSYKSKSKFSTFFSNIFHIKIGHIIIHEIRSMYDTFDFYSYDAHDIPLPIASKGEEYGVFEMLNDYPEYLELLRYKVWGYTLKEIAEKMNCNEKTIRRHLAKIKELLTELGLPRWVTHPSEYCLEDQNDAEQQIITNMADIVKATRLFRKELLRESQEMVSKSRSKA